MPARLLLLDPDRAFRVRLRGLMAQAFPEVELEEHLALSRGLTRQDFPWWQYRGLLLDAAMLGEAARSLLPHWRKARPLPGLVLLSGTAGREGRTQLPPEGALSLAKDASSDAEIKRVLGKLLDSRQAAAAQEAPGLPPERPVTQPAPAAKPPDSRPVFDILLPGYTLKKLLGEGGMSRVFLARANDDKRLVAIKLLDSARVHDPALLKRFITEHRILATVRHPRLVAIDDYKLTRQYAYIAMEYLPCGDLAAKIAAGIEPAQAMRYLRQLAEAMDAIHSHDIIHRDIKPTNLMFRANGGLVLTDFGVARDRAATGGVTQLGFVIGTPAYLAPERALGAAADERSDLYSAGAVLFEMLTGRKLYTGNSAREIFLQHVNAPVPRLPRRLAAYQLLLDRLLAKREKERVQSAAELLYLIDEYWPDTTGQQVK
jgi:hypothetical protein